MDFGIDTIIYIILGLVFFVAQASKKKKVQAQRDALNSDGANDNEDASPPNLLEEYLSQKEDIPTLSSDGDDFNEAFFDNLKEEKIEDLPKGKISELVDDQKERSTQAPEFDLRNAVIYSAILERKYF